MSSLKIRGGNPFGGSRATGVIQTVGAYAAELDTPPRLRERVRRGRTVPPILDIRPIDIYSSFSVIYRVPGLLAAPYKSNPRYIPGT
jgi:hypothetical protein